MTKKNTTLLYHAQLHQLIVSMLILQSFTIDMNQTVAALEAILSYFDQAAQEESIVSRPFSDNDLQPYFQSIGRIREYLRAMSSVKLKAGDRVVQQLVRPESNIILFIQRYYSTKKKREKGR